MPNYPRHCLAESCDHWFVELKPMADSDVIGTCPKCDGPAEKAYLPSGVSTNADPVIVFKAHDGTFRYPGDDKGLSVKNYEKLGYERVEIRGWAAMRHFERTVNTQQGSEIARRVERQLEVHEASVKMRRSEVTNALRNGALIPEMDEKGRRTGRMKSVRFSEAGKELMRQAMDRNDRKPTPRTFSGGFHSEVYNYSRGNRDESRRPDGTRFKD